MEFENIKNLLKEELEAKGIEEYEIYYSGEGSTSVETLNREINNFSSSLTGGICLRVLHAGKMGYAATELTEESELKSLVQRALMNAEATDKEDTVGIFAGGSYEPLSPSDFTPKSTAELRRSATEIAEKIYGYSDLVTDGTATNTSTISIENRLYNSHGVSLSCSGGVNIYGLLSVVKDGDRSESDYAYGIMDKDCFDEKIRETVDSAKTKLGAKLLETGEYNVVIDPKQMRALLATFAQGFSAKKVQMDMSRLKGKVGERIASDIVTIVDDPMRPDAVVRTNFDAEGVPARKKEIVSDGVLVTLLHNRETAKRDGVESTGNASKASYAAPIDIRPYSFSIAAGDKTDEELYSLAGNGVLITELKGLHSGANPITGDFSLESAGRRIVDGKLGESVRSFTVAGNFFELLSEISALSDNVSFGISGSVTSYGAPAALVRNIKISGV